MNEVQWKLNEVKSEEEFHDLVQCSLSFPHYYGRNRNAFWDCLNEIVEKMTVRVSGREGLTNDLRSKIDDYLNMCKEYEEKTEGRFRFTAIP